jgi:hypothetical protein
VKSVGAAISIILTVALAFVANRVLDPVEDGAPETTPPAAADPIPRAASEEISTRAVAVDRRPVERSAFGAKTERFRAADRRFDRADIPPGVSLVHVRVAYLDGVPIAGAPVVVRPAPSDEEDPRWDALDFDLRRDVLDDDGNASFFVPDGSRFTVCSRTSTNGDPPESGEMRPSFVSEPTTASDAITPVAVHDTPFTIEVLDEKGAGVPSVGITVESARRLNDSFADSFDIETGDDGRVVVRGVDLNRSAIDATLSIPLAASGPPQSSSILHCSGGAARGALGIRVSAPVERVAVVIAPSPRLSASIVDMHGAPTGVGSDDRANYAFAIRLDGVPEPHRLEIGYWYEGARLSAEIPFDGSSIARDARATAALLVAAEPYFRVLAETALDGRGDVDFGVVKDPLAPFPIPKDSEPFDDAEATIHLKYDVPRPLAVAATDATLGDVSTPTNMFERLGACSTPGDRAFARVPAPANRPILLVARTFEQAAFGREYLVEIARKTIGAVAEGESTTTFIDAERRITVEGVVRDAQGRLAPGVLVDVFGEFSTSKSPNWLTAATRANDDGRFSFVCARDAPLRFHAVVDGLDCFAEVPKAHAGSTFELRAPAARTVTLELVDENGCDVDFDPPDVESVDFVVHHDFESVAMPRTAIRRSTGRYESTAPKDAASSFKVRGVHGRIVAEVPVASNASSARLAVVRFGVLGLTVHPGVVRTFLRVFVESKSGLPAHWGVALDKAVTLPPADPVRLDDIRLPPGRYRVVAVVENLRDGLPGIDHADRFAPPFEVEIRSGMRVELALKP